MPSWLYQNDLYLYNLKWFWGNKSFDDVILPQTRWFLKLHHQKKKKSRKRFRIWPITPKGIHSDNSLRKKKLECKSENSCRMQSCVIKLLNSVAFKLHLRWMFFVNDIERDSKIISFAKSHNSKCYSIDAYSQCIFWRYRVAINSIFFYNMTHIMLQYVFVIKLGGVIVVNFRL